MVTRETWKDRWSRWRQRRWVRWLMVDGLVLVLALVAIGLWQARHHPRGVAFPAGHLTRLDGSPVALESWHGKPVMLAFWAPWCGVCKVQSGNVARVWKLAGERAHVVSVAASYRDLQQVQRYMAEQGVAYPVLLADEALLEKLKVTAFPTTFFLDREGHIDGSVAGYATTLGLWARLVL